jgi:hypothetical protein
LKGGNTLFAYVSGRPIVAADPLGLVCDVKIWRDQSQMPSAWDRFWDGLAAHEWVTWPGGGAGFYPVDENEVSTVLGVFRKVPGVVKNDADRQGTSEDTAFASGKAQTCPCVLKCLEKFKSSYNRSYCVAGNNCRDFVDEILGACGLTRPQASPVAPKNCVTVNGKQVCAGTGI